MGGGQQSCIVTTVIVVAYYFQLSIVDELSISLLRIRNASISYVRPRALSFAIVISVIELIAKVTPIRLSCDLCVFRRYREDNR